MIEDLGHWVCDIPVPIKAMGFIYKITCLDNNKYYIGKKQIISNRKKNPLKGRTNKRSNIVETDWKTYTSSCNGLKEEMKRLGKDHFEFRIIRFCNSKSELSYYEAKEQFDSDALLDPNCFNGIVNLRISKIKIDPLEYPTK